MKTTRKLHLWIGIISSLFILIQAITGLLLSEPWLIGGETRDGVPQVGISQGATSSAVQPGTGTSADRSGGTLAPSASADSNAAAQQQGNARPSFNGEGGIGGPDQKSSGLLGFVKGLHEGMIAGGSYKIYVDLTAISLIFLTSTGIFLSIRVLRAQSKQRRKSKTAQTVPSAS
ncbi:PepSY domain-containing protein [Paenibacillus sp. sptzw28]|uniref:PepSY-associated TM helix domain-containing protein n=1 Tax=Paenibacillus sp. sptzw28 TaxID=715179 RepID=UPI001C6E0D1C|nr:PepSY-associated TM helix domain-containing protein [Paenibacillus sp. sptzw28]QYR21434.1 PepSY domain-containing protein [Paenibacillus sp. sptzw28]